MDPKTKLAKYSVVEEQKEFPLKNYKVLSVLDDYRKLYQSKVGLLNYATIVTRPDLVYAISTIARHNANPTQDHMDAADQVYTYLLKTHNRGLYIPRSGELYVEGYVDSDFTGCLDTRKSITG